MFKKTYVAPFTKRSAPLSSDLSYWKNLSAPILLKEINLIENIDISPVEPHFLAVTCSSRVQLYHPITRMIHKNYNRFKEAAYGGVFRADGKLLLVGSEEAALKLFDVSSKNLLRVFKGHQRAVHKCGFLPTDNHIVSFSDDKMVGHWDIPTEVCLHKFESHTDYVRSGGTVKGNPNLIVSGSYDHTVKIWDKREKKQIISVDHGAPVETVLPSPNGSLLFTGGGTEIRVWDLLSGGRLLSKISQHHKTVTCLSFASDFTRLVSGSLDRHVKIYDLTSLQVIQTLDYSSPILSLGVSPGDKTLAVGMSDGILAISRMHTSVETAVDQVSSEPTIIPSRKKSNAFSCYQVTEAGISEEGTTRDLKYDQYLRKFRYSKALDCVMSDLFQYRFPGTTVAVFQELIRRDGLRTALAGRRGNSLAKIIRFLIRHLRRPRFMRILLHVADQLVDLYANKIGQDTCSDGLFLQLCEEVEKEVEYMTELMELEGSLDMVLASWSFVGDLRESDSAHLFGDPSVERIEPSRLEPTANAQQTVVVNLK